MNDLLALAITAKLLAAIADEADESTLKRALEVFPAIIAQMLESAKD